MAVSSSTRCRALVLAAGLAFAALATTRTSTSDYPRHVPSSRRAGQPPHSLLLAKPPVVRQRRARLAPPLRLATVQRVVTTYAGAFAAWDTGNRTTAAEATLRRWSSAELWAGLRSTTVRRTNAAALRPASLEPPRVIGALYGGWRAVLTLRQPRGIYVATLVLAPTPAGPRVVEIAGRTS